MYQEALHRKDLEEFENISFDLNRKLTYEKDLRLFVPPIVGDTLYNREKVKKPVMSYEEEIDRLYFNSCMVDKTLDYDTVKAEELEKEMRRKAEEDYYRMNSESPE